MKPRRFAIGCAALLVIAIAALPACPPALFCFTPDPTELHQPMYCVMNPFRDRGPEKAAERYLRSMRAGQPAAIAPLVVESYRQHVLQREAEYPIRGWRIGGRKDAGDSSELEYWVERGGGYGGEVAVVFTVLRVRGEWRALSYGASY